MHNKMVFRAARAALELDIQVLRCTIRGVGNSGNFRCNGIGERDNVRAARTAFTRFAERRGLFECRKLDLSANARNGDFL